MMTKWSTILAVCLMAMAVYRAGGQVVRAVATIDSTHILIGDQINLKLTVEKPAGVDIQFPTVPDSLAGKIEVLKQTASDTSSLENQVQRIEQTYLITCFDSGAYYIPPFRFDIRYPDRNDSLFTNDLFLNVLTMVIDTTRGPVDIKMPYDAPLTLKEVTPYLLGIILAAALLFLLLYSIKRKKKNLPVFVKPPKPKEPAHIIALRELDKIKEEKLWQKDKIKEYYSDVTGVIRVYIENRYGIPAMEQTTYEILSSFSERPGTLNEKTRSQLSQILPLADLVKFAKYRPLPDDHNLVLINAYFFVNETKIEEQQKPEKPAPAEGGGQEVTLK